jgi:hypothetical protein
MAEILTILIADLSLDLASQPRVAGLDADHVRDLQERPEDWPPIAVVRRNGRDVPVDGLHRVAAAQNLGLESVAAEILHVGDDADLGAISFELNRRHGKHLTLEDKRQEVVRRLTLDPLTSNMQLAGSVGLSPSTVQAIRERLEAAATIESTSERVGRSGITYVVSPTRQPGELPAVGFDEAFVETVGRLFTPADRICQRRIVGFLQRLAVALEDIHRLDSWKTDIAAADACRLVLGLERATDLAERLGRSSRAVLDIAIALGYAEGPDHR